MDKFLDVLKCQHPNLMFTVEQTDGLLLFVEVNVKIAEENTIKICIYRKQTNTAVLLNFDSVAPSAWKKALVKCLLYRAKSICSADSLLSKKFTNNN